MIPSFIRFYLLQSHLKAMRHRLGFTSGEPAQTAEWAGVEMMV
jgi:hypothetical protein